MRSLVIFTFLAIPLANPATAETITLSPKNTKIMWSGSNDRQTNQGGFEKFEGSIEITDDIADTKISVEIETASITSNTQNLTNHLKTPDFFHVRKYPASNFVSSTVRAASQEDATHVVTGNLTLLGKTEKITFPVTLKISDKEVSLDSKFTLDRTDFGMNYGVGKIKKEVDVTVQVRAKRQ